MGLTEWGLVLPDGTVAWGSYKGHPLATPADRARMFLVLSQTAADLSFPDEVFLRHYEWTSRTVADPVPLTDLQALCGDTGPPEEESLPSPISDSLEGLLS